MYARESRAEAGRTLVSVPAAPLGRQQRFDAQIQQVFDGLLLALAWAGAFSLRDELGSGDLPAAHFALAFAMGTVGPLLLARFGAYLPARSSAAVAWRAAKGIGLLTVLALAGMYLLHEQVSRLVVGVFVAGAVPLVSIRRLAWQRMRRDRAISRHTVVLFGGKAHNAQLRALIEGHPEWGLSIAGALDAEHARPDAIIPLLHAHHADTVLIGGSRTTFDRLDDVVRVCETEGVDVWLMADFVTTLIARMSFDQFHGRPMLRLHARPEQSWALVVKRAIDLVAATIMLAIAGPLLMLPTALAIRLTSKGPILFRQLRCGKHGKQFAMYKFRSMVVDAEAQRAALQSLNEQQGPVFKIARDPRTTRIGRLIRKMSIDELPQLFNVLRGEMSLVGPRPPIPEEVEKYERWQRRRLSMKPGLTCLWQVRGRNDVTFEEWMKLDLEYIDNWSLGLDLAIMLRTVPVVLLGTGT